MATESYQLRSELRDTTDAIERMAHLLTAVRPESSVVRDAVALHRAFLAGEFGDGESFDWRRYSEQAHTVFNAIEEGRRDLWRFEETIDDYTPESFPYHAALELLTACWTIGFVDWDVAKTAAPEPDRDHAPADYWRRQDDIALARRTIRAAAKAVANAIEWNREAHGGRPVGIANSVHATTNRPYQPAVQP